ncbi:ketopantoate reductase [Arcobacter sp. CECT 8983]|uniref:ketopantoate reductase family protein n=1 Tax=Arcobacter sp. CECT 8983 TaxID=2044508 RepID=UPI00100BAF3C|nr:ketopantoate reductase family protein [Arcobacter sp. CECT 8983]RXJ91230.1 ketopantoate reductase [Arcobacter sp. CECT 8983]
MNIVVIGAGGIGAFYGMILHNIGCDVKFVARGKNLEYLKNNEIKLIHPDYIIEDKIKTLSIEELLKENPESIDVIFIATKSMSTETISTSLGFWVKKAKKIPYYISLQNGVENEDIMTKYYPKEYIIGGLTRLIAAHTISLGLIDSTGEVQTLIGAVYPNEDNQKFLDKLKALLDKTPTKTILCEDIKKELWNKLIINNGVNAICALLQEYSGVLIRDEKVSKIIHALMSEAALASNAVGVNLTQKDANKMFELMTNFESIKPSMWVDTEHNRDLELDEICGVVIKNCEKQGLDAPYTRSVSTILEILYNKQRRK